MRRFRRRRRIGLFSKINIILVASHLSFRYPQLMDGFMIIISEVVQDIIKKKRCRYQQLMERFTIMLSEVVQEVIKKKRCKK